MNKIVIIYLIIINIISFIIYGIDKLLAIKHLYRISEAKLITASLIGGSLGALLGMLAFRHKTQKTKFLILNPLFLGIHIYLISNI